MSPRRPVLTASAWLHQLEIQWRLTLVTFVWRPAGHLESFHSGCRASVSCATDGDLCKPTSVDIILLSALFHQSRFPLRLRRTEVSRGGGVCEDGLSVRKCIRTGEIIWPALTDFHFAFLWHGLLSNWQCSRFASSWRGKEKSLSDNCHPKWDLT